MQRKPESDFSLKSLFSINSAEAEHTATYDCCDLETYYDESGWGHKFKDRICEAQNCGRKYHGDIAPPKAECTVYYN
jgi:hypothetical protein